MALYRIEARLNYDTGLPEDLAVNTFYVNDPSGTSDLSDALDDVELFYNSSTAGSATHAMCWYLSPRIDRGTDKCEMIAYEHGVPGPPTIYRTWTLGAAGGTSLLPLEVALCSSYAGSTPGVPSARQRGRIYLGPLGAATGVITTGGAPNAVFVSDLVKASDGLSANLNLDGWTWSVLSRVNNTPYGITHGWVDNEFDTQRRRQVRATSRTTW